MIYDVALKMVLYRMSVVYYDLKDNITFTSKLWRGGGDLVGATVLKQPYFHVINLVLHFLCKCGTIFEFRALQYLLMA